ncbi:MAG TPA: polysaccharide deacetylase family protein [Candidatus Dormibacteraeota bacterium]|nr:polysaccharide deacetylase family protein [Candidatus Dormibacteraeota bacterium]
MNPWYIASSAALSTISGVTAYGACYPQSQLFGKSIYRTKSPHKLAITFDDGPNPAITPKLLDLLDRYAAQATFFVVGKFVRECPDLLRETVARGHAVGNHTETHPNLFWLTTSEIRDELRRCDDAISSAIGIKPKWFRPPFGFRNPWVVSAANAQSQGTVMWTLMPGDWKSKPADWLIARMKPIAKHAERFANSRVAKAESAAGDILCLHDGDFRKLNADRFRTLQALEYWLPRWRNSALEFVTIDEAVRTPAL